MKHTPYVIATEAVVRCLLDHGAGAPVGDGMDFKAGQTYRMVRWGGRRSVEDETRIYDDTVWWTSHDIDGAYALPTDHADIVETLRSEEGVTARRIRQAERAARYQEIRHTSRANLFIMLGGLRYPWREENLMKWTDHQIRELVITQERRAAGKHGEDV